MTARAYTMPNAAEKGWFLAQLKPNSAAIARRNLERQGVSVFLPMIAETRARNGRFTTRARPLFPGYVFVALDPADGAWRKINGTQGVSRLVSFGQRPAPVPIDLVTELQAHCDARGLWQARTEVRAGDRVVVTAGPFTQFIANVETLAPDQRVWVLMEIMGAQTRVAVDAHQVRLT